MSRNSLIIGLTGNIAAGKSTVAQYLGVKGADIIDADSVVHQLMEPGRDAYIAVVHEFGDEIVAVDGTIDRNKLGAIVFNDAASLGRLEQIVHPAVNEAVYSQIEEIDSPLVVLEAVKLLEAGPMAALCDEIWVVTASADTQVKRAAENRGMTEEEIRRRMRMQSPQAAKINQADRVIDNNGSLADLHVQLDRLLVKLQWRYARRLGGMTI